MPLDIETIRCAMEENKKINPASIREWLMLVGILWSVLIWCVSIYGLPDRVSTLEDRMKAQELRAAELNIKIDMVLDDTKTIKSFVLNTHGEH